LPGQDCQERRARKGLQGTGLTGQDCSDKRVARKEHLEQDSQNRTARSEQVEKDRQNKAAMIGLPGQDG
jgi:hypothetical protein